MNWVYTTNAIESLNRVIRKTTKTRGSFPTDEAATKLIYLAIRNFEKKGMQVDRSTVRYQSKRADDSELREEIRLVAKERRRFGYCLRRKDNGGGRMR